MAPIDRSILQELGNGKSIDQVCQDQSWSGDEFDRWWNQQLKACDWSGAAKRTLDGIDGVVSIERNKQGVPHIKADSASDLFFGFGNAVAEDRFFQLDFLRRRGKGRLSELIGSDGVELDRIARVVGLNRIAEAEWQRIQADSGLTETKTALSRFTHGVNAWLQETDQRPIEYALLNGKVEPWTETDCLAIEIEFRWYLTGRFPIIVMPEMAKRSLGDTELYTDYLTGEAENEAILHQGDYQPAPTAPAEPVGAVMSHPDSSIGSNNWVVAASRTKNGRPLLASDPHIAIDAVSCWYQARLEGGDFHVAGMSYVGMPAIMFGRNQNVAWGITNNICSQRDLYRERTSAEYPGCFEYDGNWEPAVEFEESIAVNGGDNVNVRIECSRNGPVVNELLPSWATTDQKITLKWLGAYQGGWLTSLLQMNQAENGDSFCEALRAWHVPTFSLVVSDRNDDIFYQVGGRIPIRTRGQRGYRDGWDPEDQWQGLIPFEDMPRVKNPERGWIASANNRLAPDDFPYLMHGCWSSGYRAQRIREMIGDRTDLTIEDMRNMQMDTRSLRAESCIPVILSALGDDLAGAEASAAEALRSWDCEVVPDSPGPTIFNVFYSNWSFEVASARFPSDSIDWMRRGVEPVAGRLLKSDPHGWFGDGSVEQRIRSTFSKTVAELSGRFGSNIADWNWGKLHLLRMPHVLDQRGDLGRLLSQNGPGVVGDMGTVCNTGAGADFCAATGGGYRMLVDWSDDDPTLHAVDAPSQSGTVSSVHYHDQLPTWLQGAYFKLPVT